MYDIGDEGSKKEFLMGPTSHVTKYVAAAVGFGKIFTLALQIPTGFWVF